MIERKPPGDWSQEDFEEEVPLIRASDYDELADKSNLIAAGFCTAEARYLRRIARLLDALNEIMPRYCELFEAAGLGDSSESVAVWAARQAIDYKGD